MAVAALVDTSVWIDALRDPGSPCGDLLDDLLAAGPRVVTSGLVAHEILQGLAAPPTGRTCEHLPHGLHRLNPTFATHARAAALTRPLRARGIAVHTVDAVLAQLALDHRVAIWSLDRHFRQIATATKLRLYGTPVSYMTSLSTAAASKASYVVRAKAVPYFERLAAVQRKRFVTAASPTRPNAP